MDAKEREAIKALEKLGYNVKLSKPSTKKTFEVETDLLERFTKAQKVSGLKMKQAVSEALGDWVIKNS